MSTPSFFRSLLLLTALVGPALATDPFNLNVDAQHSQAQEDDFDGYWQENGTYNGAIYATYLAAHPTSARYALFHLNGWGGTGSTTVSLTASGTANRVNSAGAAVNGEKNYILEYSIGSTASGAWQTVTAATFSIPFAAGDTEALIRVTPVNDIDATGAAQVTLEIQASPAGKYAVGSYSTRSVMVADDDIQAYLTMPTPLVSEGDGYPGAFRLQFYTTQSWDGVTTFGASGLTPDHRSSMTLYLDRVSTTDTSVERDAKPGKVNTDDYLLMVMPAHASTATTASYGTEHQFSSGVTSRLQDWTKDWKAAETAKKGSSVVYLNASSTGQFLPLDLLVDAQSETANAYQISSLGAGYLVTSVKTTTRVLSNATTVTTTATYQALYVNLTGSTTPDSLEEWLTAQGASFDAAVIDAGASFETDEVVESASVTSHFSVSISSGWLNAVYLAGGLAADISKDQEVFNYLTVEPKGDQYTFDLPTGAYYGVEMGVLPIENVVTTRLSEVEGAESIRVSVLDPASHVTISPNYELLNPGAATVTLADIDSNARWTASSNATMSPNVAGSVTVSFPAAFPRDVLVAVTVQGGSVDGDGWAQEGVDCETISRTLTLEAGKTSLSFPIVPKTNSAFLGSSEQSRKLRLTLSPSADYQLSATDGGSAATMDVEIVKGVGTVALTAPTATVVEPTAGKTTTSFLVTLARSTGVNRAVAVSYEIASGSTATAADYDATMLTGTVTIPAGATSLTASIPVDIFSDSLAEGAETLTLNLIEGNGYGVDSNHNSATITIYDSAPTISIASSATSINEGGSAVITLSYTGVQRAGFPVTLSLSGTASSADYDLPTTATFTSTATSVSLTLTAVADKLTEGDETLTITIAASSDSSYFLGSTHSVDITIKDTSVADGGTASDGSGDTKPTPSTGGGSTSSGCGLGSGVAGILLGMFLLLRLRLRSDKRSRAA